MRLDDIASFIKSANAGASMLTFDIGFDNRDSYERAKASGVLTPDLISRLYPVTPEQVQIYDYDPALVIKITIPRPGGAGGYEERDFDGVQQFAPLLSIEI